MGHRFHGARGRGSVFEWGLLAQGEKDPGAVLSESRSPGDAKTLKR